MATKWLESLVLLLLAASVGCVAAAPPGRDGRLELTVVPESLLASGRPLHGSFELQALDGTSHVSVPVDGAGYQTRSVALAPGVYSLRWQAPLEVDPCSEQAALNRANAASSATHTVVIAPQRVTALTVRSTLDMARAPQPVATIAQPAQPPHGLSSPF